MIHNILWYTLIYCGILWYTVVSLPSPIGQTSGTMVPSTSEDRSEAEVLHDPHDYDEVPVEEMASRPPMPVPAPSDVYSEVRGEREGERGGKGERGREGGRERWEGREKIVHVHNFFLCVTTIA